MGKIVTIILLTLIMLSFSGCTESNEPEEPTPTATPTTTATPQPTQVPLATPTECGTDFDCFIEAVENGNNAGTLHTTTIDLFGMLQTTTAHMKNLKLGVSGNYEYYQRTESVSLEFNKELKQQMLDSNLTQEEIIQQEQQTNEQAQLTVGIEATCKYGNPVDLVAVLNNWKQGNYSTNDFDFCTEFTATTPTPTTTPTTTPTATPRTEPAPPTRDSTKEGINLSIDIPKTTYQTGEEFSGRFRVFTNERTSLESMIVYCYSEEGDLKQYPSYCVDIYYSEEDWEGSGIFSPPLKAFKTRESDGVIQRNYVTLPYFLDPGVYTYSIYVFKCDDIIEKYSSRIDEGECNRVGGILLLELNPLDPWIYFSKDITVTGESIPIECSYGDDCTEPCEFCEDEIQTCINFECVDCITIFGCLDGYDCEEYKCVPAN